MVSGSNQLHCIVRNKTELFSKDTEVIWTERLKCQIELDEIFSQRKVLTHCPLLIYKLHQLPSLDEMLHLRIFKLRIKERSSLFIFLY